MSDELDQAARSLLYFAELAIAGARTRGAEPTYLEMHPRDVEVARRWCRRLGIEVSGTDAPKLYGFPVRISRDVPEGDVLATYEAPKPLGGFEI